MKKNEKDQLAREIAKQIMSAGNRQRGKSSSTLQAYRTGWKDFSRWCKRNHQEALPATTGTLVDYFMERTRELAPSTLRGRLAAIKHYHEDAGYPSPTEEESFQDFWAGLQEPAMHALVALVYEAETPFEISERQKNLIPEEGEDFQTLRDRALLLTGLFGDLRRSEIIGIDLEDVTFQRDNKARILIKETPSDEPKRTVVLQDENEHLSPVRALRMWIETAQIKSGPLFRGFTRHGQLRERRLSHQSVTLIVKRAARLAGMDPSAFSAEDLRQRPAK